MERVKGLDSIRFICALIVALGHFGFPFEPALALLPNNLLFNLIHKGIGVLFNGPAAVIVFFVISGMCIHLPYAGGKSVNIAPYYGKRLIRIGIPALAAALLLVSIEGSPSSWNNTVFWSIFCEITYYLIYPLLLIIRNKIGWIALIGTSYILSTSISLSHTEQLLAGFNSYTALGGWTWMIGLPCWLLGCALAENYRHFPKISRYQIWLLRFVIFTISVTLRIIKFHTNTILSSNVFTLNAFAVLVFLWVGLEAVSFKTNKPPLLLEEAGAWSYSLYLIHPLALGLVFHLNFLSPEILGGWKSTAALIFSLAFSYMFYLICERPAHKFAYRVGEQLQRSVSNSRFFNSLSIKSE